MYVIVALVVLLFIGSVGFFLWSLIQGSIERHRQERQRMELREIRHRSVLAMSEKALAAVADKSTEALEAELRIAVVKTEQIPPHVDELVVVARPLSNRLVGCVTFASSSAPLPGIPRAARARLSSHTDDALVERALAQTLCGEPPVRGGDSLEGPVAIEWLCHGARVFGTGPLLVAACGDEVRWIEARSLGDGRALGRLLLAAQETGRLQGTLLFWNGSRFHDVGVLVHTLIGPDTPDFTLVDVPEAMRRSMALGPGHVPIYARAELNGGSAYA